MGHNVDTRYIQNMFQHELVRYPNIYDLKICIAGLLRIIITIYYDISISHVLQLQIPVDQNNNKSISLLVHEQVRRFVQTY